MFDVIMQLFRTFFANQITVRASSRTSSSIWLSVQCLCVNVFVCN